MASDKQSGGSGCPSLKALGVGDALPQLLQDFAGGAIGGEELIRRRGRSTCVAHDMSIRK